MDKICPLCNGLWEYKETCPECGAQMDTYQMLQDYIGPYSPYMEKGENGYELHEQDKLSRDICIHLFNCAECGCDKRAVIGLIEV